MSEGKSVDQLVDILESKTSYEIAELTVSELKMLQGYVESIEAEAKWLRCRLTEGLTQKFESQVIQNLESDGNGYGTANIAEDGLIVKAVRPKKVEWHQRGLKEAELEIASLNQEPRRWVKRKLYVTERAFADAPSRIKAALEDAREVSPGPIKFTIQSPEAAQ